MIDPRGLRHLALSLGGSLFAVVLGAAIPASPVRAQDADTCLMCHDDRSLTKNERGQVVSLYVDLGQYNSSVHGREGVGCVDCHQSLAGVEDWPHVEELPDVDCGQCHDDIATLYAGSLHGVGVAQGVPIAPRCWTCHGSHDITPPENPESRVNRFNIPVMCGRCHKEGDAIREYADVSQDSVLTQYSFSIHGEGLYKRGLTKSAVCSDCHTAHNVRNHKDPQSSIHRDNIAGMCQNCHGMIEKVHAKVIEGRLWESEPAKVPACIECHEPHKIRRVFYNEGMADTECLKCHGRSDLVGTTPANSGKSMYVDHAGLAGSVHAKKACIQCHTGATPSHARPCDTVPGHVDCAICHAEVVETYKAQHPREAGHPGRQGHSRLPGLPRHARGPAPDESRVEDVRAQHPGPVREVP